MILCHPVLVKEAKQEQLIGMASNNLDTQEIAANTPNFHLTSRVRVQLGSSLQEHLKALSKLTGGIERANHHTQLLQTTIESRRTPKRTDTQGHTKDSR